MKIFKIYLKLLWVKVHKIRDTAIVTVFKSLLSRLNFLYMGQCSPSFNVKCLGPALHLPKHHLHFWMQTTATRGNWGKEYNKSNLQEYLFWSILIPFSNNQELKGFQRLQSVAAFPNLILPWLFKPHCNFYLSVIFICNNEFHVTGKVFLWWPFLQVPDMKAGHILLPSL